MGSRETLNPTIGLRCSRLKALETMLGSGAFGPVLDRALKDTLGFSMGIVSAVSGSGVASVLADTSYMIVVVVILTVSEEVVGDGAGAEAGAGAAGEVGLEQDRSRSRCRSGCRSNGSVSGSRSRRRSHCSSW